MPPERRLAAILSADVVGYSRLMAEDEQGTIQTLNAYREAIGTLVEQHHGRVVDSLLPALVFAAVALPPVPALA